MRVRIVFTLVCGFRFLGNGSVRPFWQGPFALGSLMAKRLLRSLRMATTKTETTKLKPGRMDASKNEHTANTAVTARVEEAIGDVPRAYCYDKGSSVESVFEENNSKGAATVAP